ncbi:MAG: glycoside hydrolase family 13 protein [Acutalibacteraceae bacterium]
MPRAFSCSSVQLVIHKDEEDTVYHNMYWCGMEGESEERWDITLDFTTGLYFYHFTYETPFGKGNIFLKSNGMGEIMPEGKEWQLTVYDENYTTPQWIKGGIMYQIFPDRFNIGKAHIKNVPSDRIIHENTEDIPVWQPNKDGKITNNDYFCGNLKGIEEKLPYIKSLGVNAIYLNPIFEAHENHRYNTADYSKIDSMLGSESDFKDLCESAEKLGIKIILDGVFSHTGSDSIYFNKENRYNSLGAYNSIESPYRDWFTFKEDGTYKSWWGIKTLPETNEENDGFIEYITGKNGIIKKWLKLGACGYRLDVADELPDKFLDSLTKSVKEENENYIVIGEIWEDATNKISHGGRRRYLLGNQLDSVMNYPFSSAIITFMRYGVAENFMDSVMSICENYPAPALNCLMNHIGTHDTARILTSLIYDSIEHKPRNIQVNCELTEDEYSKAKKLLKNATVLQYTLPGFPSVYYGDEAGLTGGGDPFNRKFYPWGKEDTELIEWYRHLGEIRNSLKVLAEGRFIPYSAMLSCAAYFREDETEKIMVISNMNSHSIDYYLPGEFQYSKELLFNTPVAENITVEAESAVILKIKNHR